VSEDNFTPIIRAAGDAAVMVDLGDRIDLAVNRRVHGLVRRLYSTLGSRVRLELVPGYSNLLIGYDPATLDFEDLATAVREAGLDLEADFLAGRRFVLPVAYGDELGPDLDTVAALHGLTPAGVVALHAGRDYPIFCMGFAPGFPFLGELPENLHTPLLETPRPSVPAGSVAIGGRQTGVYPASMPGGWRLIGRTPMRLFDAAADPPVPYGPGDFIRFEPVERMEYDRLLALNLMPKASDVQP
jgi:KipI family sensor histidine kinase inhibitor